MRKYESIWMKLKDAGYEQKVVVAFNHPDQLQTIINMVQLEKSADQKNRKAMKMPSFGRLCIERRMDKKEVVFWLKDSGALI